MGESQLREGFPQLMVYFRNRGSRYYRYTRRVSICFFCVSYKFRAAIFNQSHTGCDVRRPFLAAWLSLNELDNRNTHSCSIIHMLSFKRINFLFSFSSWYWDAIEQ